MSRLAIITALLTTGVSAQSFDPGSDLWDVEIPGSNDGCCFDLDGDAQVDNAFASIVEQLDPLLTPPLQTRIDNSIADGDMVRIFHWRNLPAGLVDGPVHLDVYAGVFAPTVPAIGDRAAGLGSVQVDPTAPNQGPNEFSGAISSGIVGLAGDRLDLPLFSQIFAAGSTQGQVPIRNVMMSGTIAENPAGCNGVCTTASQEFAVGGVVMADELYGALNAAFQQCGCRGVNPGEDVLLFGEDIPGGDYDLSCTANTGSDAGSTCGTEGREYCDDIDDFCFLPSLQTSFIDIDTNDNGAVDAYSVGLWLQLAGTNTTVLDLIFDDGFGATGN